MRRRPLALIGTALMIATTLAPMASAHLNVLGPSCQGRIHAPGPHGVVGPYHCYPVRHAEHGDDEIVHAGADDLGLIDRCYDRDPLGGLTDPVDRVLFEVCSLL